MSWSEPFREQRRGAHEPRAPRPAPNRRRSRGSGRSTSTSARPSSAKIATVSTRYMTTPSPPFTVVHDHDHAKVARRPPPPAVDGFFTPERVVFAGFARRGQMNRCQPSARWQTCWTKRARDRLDDFGADTFREAWRSRGSLWTNEARSTRSGERAMRARSSAISASDCRSRDWYRRHPEIADRPSSPR